MTDSALSSLGARTFTLALNDGDGQGTHNLIFNFGSKETPSRVQSLIRALQFGSTTDGSNSFSLSIKDASSSAATSTAVPFTVDVLPAVTSANISISGAGNATVNDEAPAVTDAHLSISGASGAGNVLEAGDTITATWDDTNAGDGSLDVVAPTVDVSALG